MTETGQPAATEADREIARLERENAELRRRVEDIRKTGPGAPKGPMSGLRLWRRVKTRLALLAARKPLSPQTGWVLETGLFDASAYKAQAGLNRVTSAEAASHYAMVGEAQGLRPNADFDPQIYAAAYPEVLNSKMGLLVHYARHGVQEGRLRSFDPKPYIRAGRRAFEPGKPTMLVASHEASRTGAPILAWNLLRAFGETHNVIAVLLSGGELEADFEDFATIFVGPFENKARNPATLARVVAELVRQQPIDFAIVNSIVSHPLLFGLADCFIPAVALVHEFASDPNIHPAGAVSYGARMASEVVFDALAQRQAALDEWPGVTPRNLHVFHQGASAVPRARKADLPAGEAKPRPDIGRLVRGTGGRPVVLGLGSVAMRKGVDLFVSIAQAVVAELGPEAVRFVWIGGTPKPHPEGVYCGWIADQIRRAGLSKVVELLEPVDDLTEAFAAAAVVVSPSRLDPFPNVAMDAALAGVPLVCFDKANGFADFLAAHEATRSLVVPYLDVAAAARCVTDLLGDEARRAALGQALRDLSTQDFAMPLYIERLRPVIAQATLIAAQERRDTEFLEADDTFKPLLWVSPHEPVPPGKAVRFHIRKAASGQESNQYCRRPALGFVPQVYAEHHPALDASPFENPLAHWIRAGKPQGPWSHAVTIAEPGPVPSPSRLRAALHVHLHYPELAEGVLGAMAANQTPLDIFVSTTSADKAADIRHRFAAYAKGPVTIEVVPNRGRDIGPMLTIFADRLLAYDVVGHVHGKRSLALTSVGLSTDIGVVWYEFLLQHLLGAKFPMVDVILGRFAAEPSLGLVFPEDPNLTGWSLDRDIAIDLAARMDPAMVVPRFIDFPIGTMFWARPAALKPLFDAKFEWSDYPEEPVPIDGTMLHALERLLPVVCRHAGFHHETTHVPGVNR